jgi:hypothetical protein
VLRPGELAILLTILLPLVFVVWAWQHGNGLPYFEDANESFLGYVHAKNMQRFRFTQTYFITFEGPGPDVDGPTIAYTHNPNLPRYGNFLLLMLGVESLTTQILILSLTQTLASLLCLRVLLSNVTPVAPWAMLVVLVAFVLDSMGFLSWTVNTYRVLSFALLWGSLAATVRPRAGWLPFLAGFLLFHFEYGFAIFAGTATVIFVLLRDGRNAIPRLTWFALGAGLSMAIYAAQAVAYLGLSGVHDDVLRTLDRRGPSITFSDVFAQVVTAVTQRYGSVIPLLGVWALVTAPLVLIPSIRRAASGGGVLGALRLGLGQLQLSLGLGCLMTVLLLRSFFADAYAVHFLPCLVFLLGTGVATAATDVALMVGAVGRRLVASCRWDSVGPILAAVVAAGIMLTNFGRVFELYPPLSGDLATTLATKYQGLPFVGLYVRAQLAYAVTGTPADQVWVIVTDDELERAARLRTPDGQLYYLCFDPVERGPICDFIDNWHTKLGHTVVDRGKDWSIVRLAAQNAPSPDRPRP